MNLQQTGLDVPPPTDWTVTTIAVFVIALAVAIYLWQTRGKQ